jgi:hypothetical protein
MLHSGERKRCAPTSFRSVCTYDALQIKRTLPVLAAFAVFHKLKQTRRVNLSQCLAGSILPLDEMQAFHAFLPIDDDFRGCITFPGSGRACSQSRTGQRSCLPVQK